MENELYVVYIAFRFRGERMTERHKDCFSRAEADQAVMEHERTRTDDSYAFYYDNGKFRSMDNIRAETGA